MPAARTNVVGFTTNRKFKFLQDSSAELSRDPAAASCESRRFISSLILALTEYASLFFTVQVNFKISTLTSEKLSFLAKAKILGEWCTQGLV